MSTSMCWNIRGFNIPHKRREVSEIVGKLEVDIVGIMDTRIQENKVMNVMNNCLVGGKWRIIMSTMTRERFGCAGDDRLMR